MRKFRQLALRYSPSPGCENFRRSDTMPTTRSTLIDIPNNAFEHFASSIREMLALSSEDHESLLDVVERIVDLVNHTRAQPTEGSHLSDWTNCISVSFNSSMVASRICFCRARSRCRRWDSTRFFRRMCEFNTRKWLR